MHRPLAWPQILPCTTSMILRTRMAPLSSQRAISLCLPASFLVAALGLSTLLPGTPACAQSADPAAAPASVPAGISTPTPVPPKAAALSTLQPVSGRQAREADDAYLRGARSVQHGDFEAAEREFTRAHDLVPGNRDYGLALAVAREHRLTELVQRAAKARLLGNITQADALLEQARAIDPNNLVVAQHFGLDGQPLPAAEEINVIPRAPSLAGAVELAPAAGRHSFHQAGVPEQLLRTVYGAYGVTTEFHAPLPNAPYIRLDIDDADFATAQRVIDALTHVFAVALQPKSALLATDTEENRDELQPQLEETIYLPGYTGDNITELANLARNVFDLKQVTASMTGGTVVVRGDEDTLKLLNATYDTMLGGESDVLLDVNVYEVDRSRMVNIGTQLPSSVGAFPIASTAENILNANQSLIQQAVANNLITLTGNAAVDDITELEFLAATGAVSSSQLAEFTSLLFVFGHFSGLPLGGVYLGSTSTFNLLLNSSEVRTLDSLQVRAGNHQDVSLRAGTRYPIITAVYSSGVNSSTAAGVAGLTVNGTSVSSLLNQYLGNSVSVPQVQYEDLGLTLKATPQVQRDSSVALKLDLKIEALGSGAINSLPILNSRQLTSSVTVPFGKSAMLAALVSSQEIHAINGLPGLSDLPGFQGTDKSSDKSSTELLITLTPHVVRTRGLRIEAHALSFPHHPEGAQP